MYHKKHIPEEYEAIRHHVQTLTLQEGKLLIHDFYHTSKGSSVGFWSHFLENKWLKKSIDRAKEIQVFSEQIKSELLKKFPQALNKVVIVKPFLAPDLKPSDEDARDVIRYQHTNGDAYFLYLGPIHSAAKLINLLKGFSVFKKRLGSNMKLVLCGATGKFSNSIVDALESYKYREEVIVTGKLTEEEGISLISSAYALVHPCRWERFGMPVPTAMKLGVAVLVPENSTHALLAGMSGMYFNENDPADIGEKMIRIYRDEQMRSDMIGTGLLSFN
jgi:glycosyltransferase involved in cell wall biosynthesis